MAHPAPRPLLITCMLLGCALVQPAAAAPGGIEGRPHKAPRLVREQIDELESQWRKATLAADVAAMDKLLSEDYLGISWTGEVNTKQMQLDRIRSGAVAVSSIDISDVHMKVVGPVAIVTSRAEVIGTADGRSINGAFRYTRVYQRTAPGVWKITNFEATRIPPGPEPRRHDRERDTDNAAGTPSAPETGNPHH